MATAYPQKGIGGILGQENPEPYFGNITVPFYPPLAPPIVPPPGNFSVSLAGHNYNVDTSLDFYRRTAFKHTSIPAQRDSLNFDNSSGENVVNTAGLWRRSGQNWAFGAGQKFYDAKQSNPDRYYKSKGLNPWTPHQISMLHDTVNGGNAAGSLGFDTESTSVQVMTAGKYTYYLEPGRLLFRTDTGAPVAVTDIPVVSSGSTNQYSSITHNGSYWFMACGTAGIYYGKLGVVAATGKWVAADTDYGMGIVVWANDRLWAAYGKANTNYCGPVLLAIDPNLATGHTVAASDIVTPFLAVPSAGNTTMAGGEGAFSDSWVWTAIAQGSSQIYAAGYNLINNEQVDGAVYRMAPDTNTASKMSVPNRALPMGAGEYPTALFGYLNYIFVGTNLGVRMCQTLNVYDPAANASGDLKSGPIVPGVNQPVSLPVTGFTAYKQFVWFTWNNYDGSTGLGRMDLTNFIDDLAPAYASDLMVAGAGIIDLDWDYINEAPLIAISGGTFPNGVTGVWQRSDNLVATATLESGWISYDIPENKTALFTRITAPNMKGYINVSVTPDYGNSVFIGTFSANTPNTTFAQNIMPIPASGSGLTGKIYNYTLTFLSENNESPVLNRWQLDSLPQVSSETNIMVVLSPYPDSVVEGADTWYDPYAEYYYLDQKRRKAEIVWYVEGNLSAQVIIESVEWCPERQRADYQKGYLGLIVATLKTINGFTYKSPALK